MDFSKQILITTDVVWPYICGPSIVVRNLISTLQEIGRSVYLISPNYSNTPIDVPGCSLTSLSLPLPNLKVPLPFSYRRTASKLNSLGCRPSEVHTITPFIAGKFGSWFAKKMGSKHVSWFLTDFTQILNYYNMQPMQRLVERYMHSFYSSADQVLCPSVECVQRLHKLDTNSVCHLPSAIDTQHFSHGRVTSSEARLHFGIPPDANVLLTVGRLSSEKNVDSVIRAVEQMPDVYMLIVGDGPNKKRLKTLVKYSSISNVRFLEGQSYKIMPVIYQTADVVIVASELETMPLVVLEAWASGIPLVANRYPGYDSHLRNGENCLCLDSLEVHHICNTVQKALKPDIRERLQSGGASTVTKFDVRSVYSSLFG